jgi:hypothetical protein
MVTRGQVVSVVEEEAYLLSLESLEWWGEEERRKRKREEKKTFL